MGASLPTLATELKRKEIMAKFVVTEFVAKKSERKGGPRGKRKRTEEQKPWDEAVLSAWEGSGVLAVEILPDEAEETRKRVTSSLNYHDLAGTEGVPQAGATEGHVILMWKLRMPVKRGPRKQKTAETSAE